MGDADNNGARKLPRFRRPLCAAPNIAPPHGALRADPPERAALLKISPCDAACLIWVNVEFFTAFYEKADRGRNNAIHSSSYRRSPRPGRRRVKPACRCPAGAARRRTRLARRACRPLHRGRLWRHHGLMDGQGAGFAHRHRRSSPHPRRGTGGRSGDPGGLSSAEFLKRLTRVLPVAVRRMALMEGKEVPAEPGEPPIIPGPSDVV